ncbi:MAG: diguanylate cyclase domain-containing protein, partial [Janthinobacterium lividum]
AFALAFCAAVVLGRLTILDGMSLSLVWPAAGVAAAWFCVQRDAGTRALDVTLLGVTTFALDRLTGAHNVLAIAFVASNLVQVLTFTALVRRWCPGLWGGGGDEPLASVRQLVRLLTAAGAACLAGAVIGVSAVALSSGRWSWPLAGVWVARNTAGIVLIVTVVFRVGRWFVLERPRRTRRGVLGGGQTIELLAALLASGITYAGVYGVVHGLPLGFLPLAVTVWVALRFDTTVVAVLDLLLAATAVTFTLDGRGPFATVTDAVTRALVVQADITLLAVIGLALALSRDERDASLAHAHRSAAEAERRGRLTEAVLASIQVGIAVSDPAGRLILVNDAARAWHGLAVDDAGGENLAHDIYSADGVTPLADHEQPLRRALTEGPVSGFEIVIAPVGRPPVLVVSSARPMTATDGTPLGAVVALHDVTQIRRRETELAAANERLSAHALQVERLAAASRSVLTADDPRRAICEAALLITGADATYLMQPVAHPDGTVRLEATAMVGLPAGTTLRLDPERDTSIVLTAYRESRAVFVSDVPGHPAANAALVAACATESGAWQPVVDREGAVVGILAVVWRHRLDVLDTTTTAVLSGLATEAAHAFERADLLSQMSSAAEHDALTGLVNRRRWDVCADLEIARAERNRSPLTFALIDLDRFKAYNDSHGHLAGDALLREFATAASGQLREVDTLARWGGEEFALTLPGCSATDARVVIERIRAVVPHDQTCTIGFCEWVPGFSAEDVMEQADRALYRGKQTGRNRSVLAAFSGVRRAADVGEEHVTAAVSGP